MAGSNNKSFGEINEKFQWNEQRYDQMGGDYVRQNVVKRFLWKTLILFFLTLAVVICNKTLNKCVCSLHWRCISPKYSSLNTLRAFRWWRHYLSRHERLPFLVSNFQFRKSALCGKCFPPRHSAGRRSSFKSLRAEGDTTTINLWCAWRPW